MKNPFVSFWSLAVVLASLLAAGMLPATVKAQGADTGEVLPRDEGTDKLAKSWDAVKKGKTWDAFISGETQPNDKDANDLKVIDLAAQWYAYRLTWDDYQSEIKPGSPKSLLYIQDELKRKLNDIKKSGEKADNKKFAGLFARQLAKRLKEVMEKGNLRARVNGGVMFETLAKSGLPGLVPDMVEVLENAKYPEYVKLYAIKGLKDLLEQDPPVAATPATRKAFAGKYGKAVDLLSAYIEKSPEVPKNASPAEKKRIEDVHRYFRREAIRALAWVRLPALEINLQTKKIEGPVGYWLLKVVADDVTPKASLSEKVEAAFGLFLMRVEGSPFNYDLVLYSTGKFIAGELPEQFNTDLQRAGNVVVKRKPSKKDKGLRSPELTPVRAEPWAQHSERLRLALVEMTASPNGDLQKKAGNVLSKANSIFGPIRVPFSKNAKAVGDSEMGQLRALVDKLKPADPSAYKGFDGFKIAEAGEE
jgi:hypothetical protein